MYYKIVSLDRYKLNEFLKNGLPSMILMSTDKVYLEDGYNDVLLSVQSYKLSCYGCQARELVENGGSGFAEVLQYPSASSNRTHEQEDN